MSPVLWMKVFNHVEPLLGLDGFDSIHSSRFLPLVVLRYPSHGEHAGCPGLHQQLLQCLDCSLVATLFGSKDALLYPVHMLLKLAPGQLAPTLTLRVRQRFLLDLGCLRITHTTCASFFHITVLTSAYSEYYLRHSLLEQSCSQGLAGGSLLVASTADESVLESYPVPMTRFALR